MTTAKRRNSDFFSRRFHCLSLDPSHSALFLDSSRSRIRPWETWFSRNRRLRRTRGQLAFVLVVWIDGKFFGRFGNGNSFAVRNWAERKWYIRIHYCPLLFLRDASRNRCHHTEVAVSCVITWLPPNHRNSKWHRMSLPFSHCERFVAHLWQHMGAAQDLSWSPIFLKYIINVCGFLRNHSQFWVFIVTFVLSVVGEQKVFLLRPRNLYNKNSFLRPRIWGTLSTLVAVR